MTIATILIFILIIILVYGIESADSESALVHYIMGLITSAWDKLGIVFIIYSVFWCADHFGIIAAFIGDK